MPTTLQDVTTDSRMRYREPAVSEGLNRKLAVNTPPGIYRGFRLTPDPLLGDRTVQISPDPVTSDHAAVYETLTHFSLTVRKDGPAFLLDLSSYSNQTVAIALYVEYVLGSPTSAELRAYEISPTDEFSGAAERDELIVLGQVVVPVSGAIVAASITPKYRRIAAFSRAPGAVPWYPLISNPYFIRGLVGWEYTVKSETYGSWSILASGGSTGDRVLSLEDTSGGGLIGWDATLRYALNLTLLSNQEQTLRVRFVKKCVTVPGAGTVTFELVFTDDAGSTVSTKTVAIDVSSTDASFVEVEEFIDLSGVTGGEVLKEVRLVADSMTTSAGTSIVYIDELQVHVESLHSVDGEDLVGARQHLAAFSGVTFVDPDTTYAGPTIRSDPGTFPTLRVLQSGAPIAVQPPSSSFQPVDLEIYGSLPELGRGKVLTGSTGMDVPRLGFPYASVLVGYTLLWQSKSYDGTWTPTTQPQTRAYVHYATGKFVITQNCYSTTIGANIQWARDDNSQDSRKYEFGVDGVAGYVHLSSEAATWYDTTAAGYWTLANSGLTVVNRLLASDELQVEGLFDANGLVDINQRISTLGAGLLGSAADAGTPRIEASAQSGGNADRVLMFRSRTDAVTPRYIRHYVDTDDGPLPLSEDAFTITNNAVWDNSTSLWSKDDTTDASSWICIQQGFIEIGYRAGGAGSWTNSSWTKHLQLQLVNNTVVHYDLMHAWSLTTSNSNPAAGSVQANALYAKNVVKGWGRIQTGVGPPPVLLDGFNVSSVVYNGLSVDVTFAQAMDDSNFAVVAIAESGTYIGITAPTRSASYFRLTAFNAGGTTQDLTSLGIYIDFIVLGKQTT